MKDSTFIQLLGEHGIQLPDVDRIRIPAQMLPVLSSLLRTMQRLGMHHEVVVMGIALVEGCVRLDFRLKRVRPERARELHRIMSRAEAEFLHVVDEFQEVLRNVS